MILENALQRGHTVKSPQYEYKIERVLGIGGFGITYLASANIHVGNVSVKAYFAIKEHFMGSDCERDKQTNRVVYSTPARSRVENSRKDFIAEAIRLHKLGTLHPNIVKVNEVFEDNNTAYYVMEYLDGESLREYVKRQGPLKEAEARQIMNPIISAVETMHANNMTHLDIKPDNIMLATNDDGTIRPVLIDFGLSKHYDKNGRPTSTINTLACSEGYAPMEQYAGITTFSPESDYYALGATLWFCLTGKDPKKATELLPGELENGLPPHVSNEMKRMIGASTRTAKHDRSLYDVANVEETRADSTETTPLVNPQPVKPPRPTLGTKKSHMLYVWIGIAAAALTLGAIFLFGHHDNVDEVRSQAMAAYDNEQYDKAYKLFKQIENDAVAQSYIGQMYYFGEGREENNVAALIWFKRAAKQGNADAHLWLGDIYENGYDVNKDLTLARDYYQKAASLGNSYASSQLTEIDKKINEIADKADNYYNQGNYSEAYKQCELILGNDRAQEVMGLLYYFGLGVTQNRAEAVKWFEKAAAQGLNVAMFNLGYCYENGEGVSRDLDTAREWYRKSANAGFDDAWSSYNRLSH